MLKKLSVPLILAAGILWGGMGIFVRALSAYGFTSLQITAIRLISAAILLWIFSGLFNRTGLRVHPADLPWMALLGLASLLAMTMCYFLAIQLTSLSIASILLYTAPAIVLILSAIFFREKLTARKITALILAIAGCVLVSGSSGGSLTLPGLLAGLGSGLAYALYSIIGKVVLKKYPSLTVTTYAFSFAALGSLLFCRPVHMLQTAAAGIDLPLIILMISIGLLSAALPYTIYSAALRHVEAGKASIMASVEPLVATLCGFLIYKESLTLPQMLGILMILGAIVLLNGKSSRTKGTSA